MLDIGILILNLTMVAVTCWIVSQFWGIFFPRKRGNLVSVLIWATFAVFQMAVAYKYGVGPIWTMVISVLLFLLISVSSYQKAGVIKMFLSLLLCAIWALVEMIVFSCINSVPIEKWESDAIGTVISKLLMIIGIFVVSIFWKKRDLLFVPIKYYIILLIFPVGSIFIAINEFYDGQYSDHTILTMLTYSVLIAFNVLIFEMHSKIGRLFTYDKENAIHLQQIYDISKSFQEQKEMMESFHEVKHNLVNELVVLKNSMENNDKAYVDNNFDRIINKMNAAEGISNSGNSTVDAMINFKYAVAKGKGIRFCLNNYIPEKLPIDLCDIGVILGNAIDNAVEATEKCREHEKTVAITMGVKRGELVAVIENPYEHLQKSDVEGKLTTTKKDGGRHGYGLASIEKIVEQYGGEVAVDMDNGIFVLTIFVKLGNFYGESRNFNK